MRKWMRGRKFTVRTAVTSLFALLLSLGMFVGGAQAYDDGIMESVETVTTDGTVNLAPFVIDNDDETVAVLGEGAAIRIQLDQAYMISELKYNGDHDDWLEIRFFVQSTDIYNFHRNYMTTSITDDVPFSTSEISAPIRLVEIRNLGTTSRQVAELELYGTPVPPEEAPVLSATAGNGFIRLDWEAVQDAHSYVVKRAESSEGPFTVLDDAVYGTTYTDSAVTNETTYYYVVVPENRGGLGEPSNTVSSTPLNITRAFLNVYLTSGAVKEYDLPVADAWAFVDWYDARATGIGPARYRFTLDGDNGVLIRKEYIVFDKIELIEVLEY